MFFNYQLKNKNFDDKPRKLNYKNKFKKKIHNGLFRQHTRKV